MLQDLVIMNRYEKTAFGPVSGHWLQWQTCIRKTLIGRAQDENAVQLQDGDRVYRGAEAYRYLLEVICGLHSPIVGETEVYGQFKKLCESYVPPEDPAQDLRGLLRAWDLDAKQVRKEHLAGLGSQSYGSVVRRLVRGKKHVHILGAGLLVKDILPWIAKLDAEIDVHCRTPEKAHALVTAVPRARLNRLSDVTAICETQAEGVLLVAAPMSAAEIHRWCEERSFHPSLAIDLRGETDQGSLRFHQVVSLNDIFTRIEKTKRELQDRVEKAKGHIRQLTEEKSRDATQVRPFGWDDLCA